VLTVRQLLDALAAGDRITPAQRQTVRDYLDSATD